MKAKRNLVFDIGMHTGEDTEFYLKKGFDVVAFDANPALCEQNTEKFADQVQSGQLHIVNRCISQTQGTVDFYINKKLTEWSSTSEALGSRKFGAEKISVSAAPIIQFFEEFGIPYYMKVDIEGADEIPIAGMRPSKIKPVYVSYEASSFGGACMLYAMGYKRFSIKRQRTVPDTALPNPALEGRHVEHAFKMGSSGSFGKELDSEWGTIDDCVREQVMWKNLMRNNPGKNDEWADIHAHHPGQQRFFDE